MNRNKLQGYMESCYAAVGEQLFAGSPSIAVFRHQSNRKWFAVIMEIPREKLGLRGNESIPIVNLKCDPRLIGSFRMEPGIYPAYHMNKAHWLSVALDGTADDDKLKFLLEMSYALTKGKKK